MAEIIEGRWDDLIARRDLRGRRVRVMVLEGEAGGEGDSWLASFLAWVHSHAPTAHIADDSRESIYSGTLRDPR
jgi:hypothetical protein